MSDASGDREAYAGRRVLVTGGAGFIGSRVVQRLAALGAEVSALDNLHPDFGGNPFNLSSIGRDIAFVQGDLRDRAVVASVTEDLDYVFNLAAQTSHVGSMQDPLTDVGINVDGQVNLLEACRERSPRAMLIFASTRQIYGHPDYLPVDEAHPIRPPDVNGVSKFAAEGYHRIYDANFGLRSSILRLTNTYGPGMRIRDARQTFVGIWLRRVLEGKPFQVFGDGTQQRDFNFVDDVVDAFLLAGRHPRAVGRVFNLGSSETPSLSELAELLRELVPGGGIREGCVPSGSQTDRHRHLLQQLRQHPRRARLGPTHRLERRPRSFARLLPGAFPALRMSQTISMNDFRAEPERAARGVLEAAKRVLASGWCCARPRGGRASNAAGGRHAASSTPSASPTEWTAIEIGCAPPESARATKSSPRR